MIKTVRKITAAFGKHKLFLFVIPALVLSRGAALAANYQVIHKDSVQTVFVDVASIKRTTESVGAMVKGEINVLPAPSKDKTVNGYLSFYQISCEKKEYRVTETTLYYTDDSKTANRFDNARWKNTIEKVYFLYEYLCNQSK